MCADPSGVDVSLPFDVHLVNIGYLYFASYAVRASAALRKFMITVGAKELHLSMRLKSGLATPLTLLEGVIPSVNGSALSLRNHNRSYKDDDLLTKMYFGSTYSGGTVIRSNQAGFGTTPGLADSGEGDGGSNYVLKPNTSYAFEFTPDAATDTVWIATFYEENGW